MRPGPDEVHLWIACDEEISDASLLARYRSMLSADEVGQLTRFRQPRHRHQYLVARALLRHVLGLYLDIAPEELIFGRTAFGKPYLLAPDGRTPSFNLSHTDGRIALAVAGEGEVGVDIESALRNTPSLEIARRFFSPIETEQLLDTPLHLQAGRFLDFWTLKEAYIKACGEGLSIPLDDFWFTFGPDHGVRIGFQPQRDDQAELWQFWQVFPGADHRIAIAHRTALSQQACTLTSRMTVPLGEHRTILPATIGSPSTSVARTSF